VSKSRQKNNLDSEQGGGAPLKKRTFNQAGGQDHLGTQILGERIAEGIERKNHVLKSHPEEGPRSGPKKKKEKQTNEQEGKGGEGAFSSVKEKYPTEKETK